MNNLTKLLLPTGALVGLSLFAGAWNTVQSPAKICFTTELIGMNVVSTTGDDLGKIEDIVVHPGGEPAYAVLSFGGWLGMGDKLFAMPWSVLGTIEAETDKKDSKHSLVLALDKEKLKSAPGFDKKNWPTFANADWAKDVDAFYEGKGNPNAKRPVPAADKTSDKASVKTPVKASGKTSVITWRASDLMDTNVKSPKGEKLGEVEEIAIDTDGRVSYVAVEIGGFLGVDDCMVAVPWDALKFSLGGDKGDKKTVTLARTNEQLEKAPRFLEGMEQRAKMTDPKWIARVYEYYSIPAYTSVVAPAKASSKAPVVAND
jgi:sporulation protein YlmC with PRC-barrel domain